MGKNKKNIQPGVKSFRLSELKPAKYNPRTISDEAMAGLTASLQRFGCVEPIVVNIRGGKNTIIGGHQRHRALKDLHGPSHKCLCVTVDLKSADEKLLNITLNNPHVQGAFVEDLAEHIDKLRAELGNDKELLDLRIAELQDAVIRNGCSYREEELRPFKKTHILISFSPELLPKIQGNLQAIIATEGIEYEQGSN